MMEIEYQNGDAKVNLVLADDANVEEVMNALTKIVGKKKKEVTEEIVSAPQLLTE